jgi:hypothetical protein
MKKITVVTFLFISIFIVTSCNKVDSIVNPRQQFEKNEFTTMTGVLNSVNQIGLENILKDKNEAQASLILQPLSKKIISFIYSNYKIDISKSTDIAGIIIIGALIAKKEQELFSYNLKDKNKINGSTIQNAPGMDCFITAVSSVIGIADARNLYLQFVNGVSAETILGTVRLLGKRVAGILTLTFTVYELGKCIGWWEEISVN